MSYKIIEDYNRKSHSIRKITDVDNIFIIAGGLSVKNWENYLKSSLQENVYRLGVNESSLRLLCQGAFTMDRLWFENRIKAIEFSGYDFFMRKQALKQECDYYNLHVVDVDHLTAGLNLSGKYLHGKNSGFAAFNLAVLCKPKRIFLFGFDMKSASANQPHWHENYAWNQKGKASSYDKWINDFEVAHEELEGTIDVYNCSDISKIKSFPKLTTEKQVEALL